MKTRHNEKGGALVLIAVLTTGLLLMTGVAADVGMMLYRRTEMQATTDAAALAGAWALDYGATAALDDAKLYAKKNGYTLQAGEATVQGWSRVKVSIRRPTSLLLAPFLQMANVDIGASSVAEFKLLSRGARPLGIPDQVFQTHQNYLVKLGPNSGGGGNFQALALKGRGASTFEQNFRYGTEEAIANPSLVPTETGNMAGPADRAARYLLSKEPAAPSYDEVLRQAAADPDSITQYPRIITVCIVKDFALSGRGEVEIVGFARFYLDSSQQGEIRARFIDRMDHLNLSGTKYRARLVE